MMKKKTSTREKGITLIALIVTIIVLLILAGVTINLAVNNQGIFNKAKTATRAYKNASENEQTGLDEADKEIAKYMPKEGSDGGNGSGTSGSGSITYTDQADNTTKTLTKDTPVGTKIGTTANIDGQTLNWYLFDVSDDGKTAYLVSTPTYWVPDTTKEVSGAWVPKLVSSPDSKTGAMNQAIQKKDSATSGNYSYSYDSSKVNYNPKETTLNYFKSVNSDWAKSENGRSTKKFSEWNENEQSACYLADADIFAGIKDQVNNAEGNLKGKIQTLVGGASVEQWCKAYNNQAEVKNDTTKQITCEYRETSVPGYIYKVNDKQSTVSNNDYHTGTNTIFGNDIYGAANNNENKTNNPFYNNSWWWLASPSSITSNGVCGVSGNDSHLNYGGSNYYGTRFSLFASVAM